MTFQPIKAAARIKNVKYAVRDVVIKAQELEKKGKKILYLNIGDPPAFDLDTPEHIKKAMIGYLGDRDLRPRLATYCDSMGIREAREAVMAYASRKGIPDVKLEDVMIASGASEAITLAIGALLNPGENILTPCPGYPLYTGQIPVYGGELRPYCLDEANEWQIDTDELERVVTAKTRAIVVINPNNPTGAVFNRESLLNVIRFAEKHNLIIFADEIYDQILFDGEKHISIAAIAGDVPVLTFNGLSKNYVMPGWRVGWLIVHDPRGYMHDVVEGIRQLMRCRLCSPHLQQYAIKVALEGPHTHREHMLVKFIERRDITFEMLNAIPGISCVKPRGAFYAYPRVQLPAGTDDNVFCLELLEETGVLVVFGGGFGNAPGTSHFRVVFLPGPDILREAYTRIAHFTAEFYTKHGYSPV